jgi:hypothetical protein
VGLAVPRDNRIRLAFDLAWLSKYAEYTQRTFTNTPSNYETRDIVESKTVNLVKFDMAMRERGGDFVS